MSTKITGLSALNVKALNEVWPNEGYTAGAVTTTATTATFEVSASEAAAIVQTTLEAIPGRCHPRASLHAVVRRLRALPDFHEGTYRVARTKLGLSPERRAFLRSIGSDKARYV